MTTHVNGTAHLDDDARFELAMAAGSRERRNRPRHLVALALVVLVAALITFGVGLGRRADAAASLSAEARRHVEVRGLVARAKAAQAATERMGSVGFHDPMPVVSTLQTLYQEARLPRSLLPPQESSTPQRSRDQNLLLKRYDYRNIQSPELAPLMRWLELAHERIPGLDVSKIELKAGPAGWTMTVTFARAERAPA